MEILHLKQENMSVFKMETINKENTQPFRVCFWPRLANNDWA